MLELWIKWQMDKCHCDNKLWFSGESMDLTAIVTLQLRLSAGKPPTSVALILIFPQDLTVQ